MKRSELAADRFIAVIYEISNSSISWEVLNFNARCIEHKAESIFIRKFFTVLKNRELLTKISIS